MPHNKMFAQLSLSLLSLWSAPPASMVSAIGIGSFQEDRIVMDAQNLVQVELTFPNEGVETIKVLPRLTFGQLTHWLRTRNLALDHEYYQFVKANGPEGDAAEPLCSNLLPKSGELGRYASDGKIHLVATLECEGSDVDRVPAPKDEKNEREKENLRKAFERAVRLGTLEKELQLTKTKSATHGALLHAAQTGDMLEKALKRSSSSDYNEHEVV